MHKTSIWKRKKRRNNLDGPQQQQQTSLTCASELRQGEVVTTKKNTEKAKRGKTGFSEGRGKKKLWYRSHRAGVNNQESFSFISAHS